MPKENSNIERIFLGALQTKSEQERIEYLSEECGDDFELRNQVEERLKANSQIGGSLDKTQNQFFPTPDPNQSGIGSGSIGHGRFLPGNVVGERYRIVSLAGIGGMGEVYRADDLKLGQTVALKFLPAELAQDRKRLAYFLQEVRLTRQISHPNVCRVYDIGEVDGQHFLSMEYIDGEDLSQLLRRIGRLPEDKGVEIAQQLCAGLAAAHKTGVLHRDLKPANVMIDGRGQVRITDFGLAKVVGDEAVGEISGTPAYMAPEQLLVGETSPQSDLYSLGLILAELFIGKRVTEYTSLSDLISQHKSTGSSVESLSSDHLDPVIESAILRCLQKEPSDRPASARQLSSLLPGADPLEAAIAAGNTPSPQLVANAPDRDLLSLPIAAVLFCLAIGALFLFHWGRGNVVMLETPPQVLSARCAEILDTLGYTDLPENNRTGASANFEIIQQLSESDKNQAWLESQPQPAYQFWRRWTSGVFVVEDFKIAFKATVDGPIADNAGEVTVIVDPQGKLLGLKAVTEQPLDDSTVDWDELKNLAGIDTAVTEPQLFTDPPIYCDEHIAWTIAKGTEREQKVQAGALHGRINYFEIIGLQLSMKPDPKITRRPVFVDALILFITLFVMLIAYMNIRASRGDWNGAIRASSFVFVLYFLQEGAALQPSSPNFGDQLFGLFKNRAWAHALANGFEVGFAYMAIEPYVRRFWPRSLVGFSRSLNGRWFDAIVGKELLIGVCVGCLVVTAMQFLVGSMGQMGDERPIELTDAIGSIVNPTSWFAVLLNAISGACLQALLVASVCVVVCLCVKRARFQVAIHIIILILMLLAWSQLPANAPAFAPFVVGLAAASLVQLMTRVGLLSVFVMSVTVSLLIQSLPYHSGSWYGPYALAVLLILLILAVVGCIASQGGFSKLTRFIDAPNRL